MSKSRPGGGRPPRRQGKGGIGPGPAYRPKPYKGKGPKGGTSAVPAPPVIGIAFALVALPIGLILGVAAYIAHGYGVI